MTFQALDTDAVEGVADGHEAPKKNTDKVLLLLSQISLESSKKKLNVQIFLSGLTDAVPGSNEFADQGANPIWKVGQ